MNIGSMSLMNIGDIAVGSEIKIKKEMVAFK
jgi:hypothetical protein